MQRAHFEKHLEGNLKRLAASRVTAQNQVRFKEPLEVCGDGGVQGDPLGFLCLGFLHLNKLGGFLLWGCDLLILADQENR